MSKIDICCPSMGNRIEENRIQVSNGFRLTQGRPMDGWDIVFCPWCGTEITVEDTTEKDEIMAKFDKLISDLRTWVEGEIK